MMIMPKVKEFASAAEVLENARAVQRRIEAMRKPAPAPKMVRPVVVTPESQTEPVIGKIDETIPMWPYMHTIKKIIKLVAKHYGVPVDALVGHQRTHPLVHYRQEAMFLARKLTTYSLPEIGRRFGGRDHTTVLHACTKIGKRLETDKAMQETFDSIQRAIETSASQLAPLDHPH
jgi:hypothetical protein